MARFSIGTLVVAAFLIGLVLADWLARTLSGAVQGVGL